MKKLLSAILLCVGISAAQTAAPNFNLLSIHGDSLSLSKLTGAGKYVFIDIFASWCGWCQASAPELEKIKQEYGNNNQALFVLGIDVEPTDDSAAVETFDDGAPAADASYLGGTGPRPTYPATDGSGSTVANEYMNIDTSITNGYPSYIIVDPNGNVVWEYCGALDSAGFKDALVNLNVPLAVVPIQSRPQNVFTGSTSFYVHGTQAAIHLPQDGAYRVSIVTLEGRNVAERNVTASGNIANLEIGNIAKGSYLVTITGKQGFSRTLKMINNN